MGNEKRKWLAEEALKINAEEPLDVDKKGAVNNLLANLRHWCAANRVKFDSAVTTSEILYHAER